jgi:hypothetical protein
MRPAPFLDNLNDAVRENPIAAGLIGMGIAWIIFGNSKALVRDSSGVARAAKNSIASTAGAATEAITQTMTGAAEQVRKAAAGVSDTISGSVEGVASKVSDVFESGNPRVSNEFTRHFPSPSRNGLRDLLERQPLALAAIGIAVGGAIASAFPSTEAEGRLMGKTGEKMRKTVADATEAVGQRAATVVEEVKNEAAAQQLTPEAIKQTAMTNVKNLKDVAAAGLESVRR